MLFGQAKASRKTMQSGYYKKEIIEHIDARFLQQWAANPPTRMTPDEIRDLTRSIEINGVQEPLLIVLNPFAHTVRLDIGNHRVFLCPIIGITHVPVVCYVCDQSIVNIGNSDHVYYTDRIRFNTKQYTHPFWCRLSDVLDIKEFTCQTPYQQ